MYICICKKVTDHQIRKAVLENEVQSLRELRLRLGACGQCGKCAPDTQAILREAVAERRLFEGEGLTAG
jgi:bacterioferritin-associated ferredoxin